MSSEWGGRAWGKDPSCTDHTYTSSVGGGVTLTSKGARCIGTPASSTRHQCGWSWGSARGPRGGAGPAGLSALAAPIGLMPA